MQLSIDSQKCVHLALQELQKLSRCDLKFLCWVRALHAAVALNVCAQSCNFTTSECYALPTRRQHNEHCAMPLQWSCVGCVAKIEQYVCLVRCHSLMLQKRGWSMCGCQQTWLETASCCMLSSNISKWQSLATVVGSLCTVCQLSVIENSFSLPCLAMFHRGFVSQHNLERRITCISFVHVSIICLIKGWQGLVCHATYPKSPVGMNAVYMRHIMHLIMLALHVKHTS